MKAQVSKQCERLVEWPVKGGKPRGLYCQDDFTTHRTVLEPDTVALGRFPRWVRDPTESFAVRVPASLACPGPRRSGDRSGDSAAHARSSAAASRSELRRRGTYARNPDALRRGKR